MVEHTEIVETSRASRRARLSPARRELLEKRLKQRLERGASAGRSIPRRSADGPAPLSSAQQRLWFLDQLAPGDVSYHIAKAFRVRGPLLLAELRRAFNTVVRRHEVLRTSFEEENGVPVQVVSASDRPLLTPVIDLRNQLPGDRLAEVRRLADREARQPFELSAGPLFRLTFLELAEQDHAIFLTLHHIIADEWSISVLVHELLATYEALIAGRSPNLADLAIQYQDYARWQWERLQGSGLADQLSFWREYLANAPPLSELPSDRPRPAVQSHAGRRRSWAPAAISVAALQDLGRSHGASLFMVLLAVFKVLLHRYTGQSDLCVGTTLANRDRPEIEPLIGFFVNTLVLRTRVDGNSKFGDLLENVREGTLEIFAHRDLPFEKIVEELQPQRALSHSPLFQILFVLQNAPRANYNGSGVSLSSLRGQSGAAAFDLSIFLIESGDVLRGVVEYNTDLFYTTTMIRLLQHYRSLLLEVLASRHAKLSDLSLLTRAERSQIVVEWNATGRDYCNEASLQRLVEIAAAEAPEAVAVVYGTETLTFRELDRRSNRLAHYLRDLGVAPEVLVGVALERSLELQIALLGILKAGGAYVPLDLDYPSERLQWMLENSRVPWVLTRRRLRSRIPSMDGVQQLFIDEEHEVVSRRSEKAPPVRVRPDQLAYVIYTSGSTGKPKGAMNTQRSITNRILWMQEAFRLTSDDCVLQKTPMSFDVSVWEFFWSLVVGARLVMLRPGGHRDDAVLVDTVLAHRVTTLHFVPSMLAYFLKHPDVSDCHCLKRVIASGEALTSDCRSKTYRALGFAQLHNLYGPTEAAVDVTSKVCAPHEPGESVAIGRPIANLQIYLLDRWFNPVPIGNPGELCIGGTGVGRGYWALPALTADRFVPDPFASEQGRRLYRTGDLVRYLPDGELDFMRRLDYQVKLRGVRIELGEVEAVLTAHDEVSQAVAVIKEIDSEDQRLVVYVVAEPASPGLSSDDLRGFLRRKLPEYMIPSVFITLAELPLTPNGKVDRRRLPRAVDHQSGEALSAPRTATEELLCGVWAEILKLEDVGTEDSFFVLGGHSLLAMQVVSRLREVFGVEIPLQRLFEAPTVKGFGRWLDEARTSSRKLSAPPIEPLAVQGRRSLPLSFAQERLWYLYQLDATSTAYNVSSRLRLERALDLQAFFRALTEIVRRHEVLRSTFRGDDGDAWQDVAPTSAWAGPGVVDLHRLSPPEREAEARYWSIFESRRAFDLERDSLLRICYLAFGDERAQILLTTHHIVADGWSVGIFASELNALYQAFAAGRPSPLPELRVQYADFAQWQRHWLRGEVKERQLAYWRRRLAGAPEVLELPLDRPRSAVQTYPGASLLRSVDRLVTGKLARLCRQEGVTLYMAVLAAFQVLLARYSNQVDFCIGTPIAGRNRVEIEGLIGFFVNTLVLRTDLSRRKVAGRLDFRKLLRRVRGSVLDAADHQDIPFDEVVRELRPRRSLSYTPFFQVFFSLEGGPPSSASGTADGRICQLVGGSGTAQFDLSLSMATHDGRLIGSWIYNTTLFDSVTVARMGRNFAVLLDGLAKEPRRAVMSQQLLTLVERHQILLEWNEDAGTDAWPRNVAELFELQVARKPRSVAVAFREERLSYSELNRRANRLANRLQASGVGPDVLVGIVAERSLEMMVCVLGVIKAGGAYLPLNPGLPQRRSADILQEARISVLLTASQPYQDLATGPVEVVRLQDEQVLSTYRGGNPVSRATRKNLACVLYTSGSTGKSKGVAITHGGIVSLVQGASEIFTEEDLAGLLSTTAIYYSCSLFEFFVTLALGGSVILIENALEVGNVSESDQVSLINIVPSAMAEILFEEELPTSVETVNLQGEFSPVELVRSLYQHRHIRRVFNGYGPTEVTTYSNFCRLDRDLERSPSIGRPMAGMAVVLLDDQGQIAPAGVIGELYIAARSGLSRGYLNQPRLTAESFLPDAFALTPGERAYRTGDLGRYLPDGLIELLGRTDNQVKIRGFRIELREIESVLERHPDLETAVVKVWTETSPENGDRDLAKQLLVAYVVAEGERSPAASDLRRFAHDHVPDYMVPNIFMVIDTMPRTANGKIDRKALPPPERPGLEDDWVAPRDSLELRITRIWEEVLETAPIGVRANFFDLGGHSLMAVRLIHRIGRLLGEKLPVALLFERPTIEELSSGLRRRETAAALYSSLVAIQPQGSGSPVFFVHPSGGSVFCYSDLARLLGPDQPFYGLQARGLDGVQAPMATIEDMAACYLEQLRAIQPRGPYRLGGWSMGGVIAFEMAQQLRSGGEESSLLAVLDVDWSRCGAQDMSTLDLLLGFIQDLGLPLEKLGVEKLGADREALEPSATGGDPERFLGPVLIRAKEAGVVPPDVELQQALHLFGIFRAHVLAMGSYRPQPYVGRISLFKAAESRPGTLGWGPLAVGGLDIATVPGHHFTIIRQPHVEKLARQLSVLLRNSGDRMSTDLSETESGRINVTS